VFLVITYKISINLHVFVLDTILLLPGVVAAGVVGGGTPAPGAGHRRQQGGTDARHAQRERASHAELHLRGPAEGAGTLTSMLVFPL